MRDTVIWGDGMEMEKGIRVLEMGRKLKCKDELHYEERINVGKVKLEMEFEGSGERVYACVRTGKGSYCGKLNCTPIEKANRESNGTDYDGEMECREAEG